MDKEVHADGYKEIHKLVEKGETSKSGFHKDCKNLEMENIKQGEDKDLGGIFDSMKQLSNGEKGAKERNSMGF